MNDIRQWINLFEAPQTSDDELRKKGYEDGLKGQVDFAFLGINRPNERVYWEGFDRAKEERAAKNPPKVPTRRLRYIVPPPLTVRRRLLRQWIGLRRLC